MHTDMNCNHPKISRNFQFDDIMLTQRSTDLPRWPTGAPQGQKTKFEAAASTSAAAQMEGRGLGREEVAVSHRMFFVHGLWGTFRPCLLPRNREIEEAWHFPRKPPCLCSDPNPSMPSILWPGNFSGYPGLLSWGCNNMLAEHGSLKF